MTAFKDYTFESQDGLRLFALDSGHPDPKANLLCLPGLTANSADYGGLAEHLSGEFRLLLPDLRGRGRSEFNPDAVGPVTTHDLTDMLRLLDLLEIRKVVLLGTSISGLTAMAMTALSTEVPLGQPLDGFRSLLPPTHAGRVQGLILNDMGPEIGAASFENGREWARITSRTITSWSDAALQLRDLNQGIPAEYSEADWLRRARGRYREEEDGRIVMAYDPGILPPVPPEGAAGEAPPQMDMWPLFEATAGIPSLVMRGELSTTLTAKAVAEMCRRRPDLEAVTVPGRGHCPTLEEPVALEAIDRFLSQF